MEETNNWYMEITIKNEFGQEQDMIETSLDFEYGTIERFIEDTIERTIDG